MSLDLKSLRYFVAVAEARSVGKAAERLHMAQPPLSVQIRNLEAQVGTPLFLRESTGMRLTDAGSALFARAREALALAHEGFEAARAVGSGRRGRLTVGYMFWATPSCPNSSRFYVAPCRKSSCNSSR